jgi:hypothetical protein
MKRLLSAIALTCVLAVSASAGFLPTSGIAPPSAPEGTSQPADSTSQGLLPTGGIAQQVSDAALSALLTALGLLTV